MGLFSKKYIYVDVCFLSGKHPYTYRTKDSSITINTVVMVPAGDEIKPAIVTRVKVYKEKNVPVPPDQLKGIIGKADRANRKLFKGVDMRMPLDISVKTVKTTNGQATVVTDKAERKMLQERFRKRNDIKLIETQPASKAYQVVSRDDAGKPVRRGYWKVQEHLSSDATFQCSRCKGVFQTREAFCPKCHSENKKLSHDSIWVDEMEMMDAIFDDDI
jgi:hypothetical protein